jgi:hypothetical protein
VVRASGEGLTSVAISRRQSVSRRSCCLVSAHHSVPQIVVSRLLRVGKGSELERRFPFSNSVLGCLLVAVFPMLLSSLLHIAIHVLLLFVKWF